jgi:hypothetical protein
LEELEVEPLVINCEADLERQLRAAWQLEADAALNNLTEMSQLDNTGNNNNE